MNIELVEVEIMLDQIIKNCLDQMQEKNLIMEDNREYYQYAMELLVEESLTVGTILVVIICMQEFVNGVIFLISFLALRRRTGGFHMKTFKACYVATIGTFIGVLLVKNIMYTYSKLLLVFTCIAASYKDFADFRRENLGFIFQDFNLLDTLTIGENISLSLVINKQNPTDIEKRVHAIADKLGIRDILSKFPYEVSGGQKQRCACARALINEPKLILADEPTGALDSKASRLLLETMSEINKKMQATILMVTHDPFSASFCERILFLKDGKIFNEIFRGEKSRKDFFNEILDILTLLGGEVGNVR